MNIKKRFSSLAVALLVVVLLTTSLPSSAQNNRQNNKATSISTKPKLVLVIVVDQLRYDYLERFADLFGKDGFRRLVVAVAGRQAG